MVTTSCETLRFTYDTYLESQQSNDTQTLLSKVFQLSKKQRIQGKDHPPVGSGSPTVGCCIKFFARTNFIYNQMNNLFIFSQVQYHRSHRILKTFRSRIQHLRNFLFSMEKSKKSSQIHLFFAANDFVFF